MDFNEGTLMSWWQDRKHRAGDIGYKGSGGANLNEDHIHGTPYVLSRGYMRDDDMGTSLLLYWLSFVFVIYLFGSSRQSSHWGVGIPYWAFLPIYLMRVVFFVYSTRRETDTCSAFKSHSKAHKSFTSSSRCSFRWVSVQMKSETRCFDHDIHITRA